MKKYWLSKNLLLVSLLIADCTSIGYGIQLDWDTTGLAGTGVTWRGGVGRTRGDDGRSTTGGVASGDPGTATSRRRRRPRNTPRNCTSPLISSESKSYIDWLLNEEWTSTGLGMAVVQKLPPSPSPSDNNTASDLPRWKIEFASFGAAQTSIIPHKPVTPDTLFAIASNSKLFLSLSVGMLLHNRTLASQFQNKTGKRLGWGTKMVDLLGEDLWRMWDEDATRGATVLDLLLHRTGLPRHDFSGTGRREGGVRGVIETLHSLRPSASFRLTTQYNNLMYETLSYLPQLLLNQSYESYVHQHLLAPLNMSSTFFDVGLVRKGEEFGDRMAEGHLADMRDFRRGRKGVLKPVVPYFFRPGEEKVWAGAGGLISSPRDMATWVAMLLNDGRHPYTNAIVVPKEVLDFVSTGRVVTHGTPEFPEFSPKVYGPAQWRYTYQGLDIIEHGGNNAGFKSQVARFPSGAAGVVDDVDLVDGVYLRNNEGLADGGLADGGLADGGLADGGLAGGGLAVVSLSNDGEHGGFVLEAAKWRIVEDVFGLREVDWSARYKQLWKDYQDKVRREALPPPPNPKKLKNSTARAPSGATLRSATTRGAPSPESFVRLGQLKFSHPAYGKLTPCLVPGSLGVEGVGFGSSEAGGTEGHYAYANGDGKGDGDFKYAYVEGEGKGDGRQVPFAHAHASSREDVESSFPNPHVDCARVLGGADARRALRTLSSSSLRSSASESVHFKYTAPSGESFHANSNAGRSTPVRDSNHPRSDQPKSKCTTLTYTTPTYLIPFPRTFATHLVLTHYEGMVFNVSVVWGNAGLRASVGLNQRVGVGLNQGVDVGGSRGLGLGADGELDRNVRKEGVEDGNVRKEGRHGEEEEDRGAILIGLDEHFEVEWVVPPNENGPASLNLDEPSDEGRWNWNEPSDEGGWNNEPSKERGRGWETEGLSFKRGFWGREGMDSEEPADGLGRGSAEVWFGVGYECRVGGDYGAVLGLG